MKTANATANGSDVMEATSNGPTATRSPSPRLLASDAAHSQRKLSPRLRGAIRAPSRLTARAVGIALTLSIRPGPARLRYGASVGSSGGGSPTVSMPSRPKLLR